MNIRGSWLTEWRSDQSPPTDVNYSVVLSWVFIFQVCGCMPVYIKWVFLVFLYLLFSSEHFNVQGRLNLNQIKYLSQWDISTAWFFCINGIYINKENSTTLVLVNTTRVITHICILIPILSRNSRLMYLYTDSLRDSHMYGTYAASSQLLRT